jgi:hypothetical protein
MQGMAKGMDSTPSFFWAGGVGGSLGIPPYQGIPSVCCEVTMITERMLSCCMMYANPPFSIRTAQSRAGSNFYTQKFRGRGLNV